MKFMIFIFCVMVAIPFVGISSASKTDLPGNMFCTPRTVLTINGIPMPTTNTGNLSANYHTARDMRFGYPGYFMILVGQELYGGYYSVYRGFLFFDTSSLPDDAKIDSAAITVVPSADDVPILNYSVVVQNGLYGHPHNPIRSDDFYRLDYTGNGGCTNTSGHFAVNSWFNISLNRMGRSWINKTGVSTFTLRTDREIAGVTPLQDVDGYTEALSFYAYRPEHPVIYRPKLTITYHTEWSGFMSGMGKKSLKIG